MVFFNPMKKIHSVGQMSLGSATDRRKVNGISCSGVLHDIISKADKSGFLPDYCSAVGLATNSYLVPIQKVSDSVINDMLSELSTKVLSDRGKTTLNLGEALAEADRSLVILADLFANVNRVLVAKSLKSGVRSLADIWLLTRYGLRPLISDIFGAMEALEKDIGRVRKTTRAFGTLNEQSVRVITKASATVTHYIREEQTERVELRLMSLDELTASLSFNLGFGVKNLLTLPYELIPLSFVLDWFLNIRNRIGSLVPDFGLQQLGQCYVVRSFRTNRITAIDEVPIAGWTSFSKDSGEYYAHREIVQRIPGLPSPRLQVNSDFRLSNINRALDSLSLVVQRLSH
jgi:hypothetical protein